ncbi:MAG: hypothetical protein IKP31_05680 [Lachnospiraceae bacterium]|nr:hypothetical protein [Lachnospiraceae bacterium]
MKNRRIASLMTFVIIISTILSVLAPTDSYAVTNLTMTEGTGKGPSVEVIRVDENGNEIIDEEKKDSESENSGDEKEDHTVDPVSSTYEDDIQGFSYPDDQMNLTTIYVSTPQDLIKLARNCRLDTWSRDKNVVLTDDILLDGSNFKYIPIFGGVFDGQGHTISGVNVTDSESYTGLFCITQESALIKDLKVQGSLIPSGDQLATGGIVGDNYGIISNCTFEGNISGYDYSGGIAGYNEQTGNITSCTSKGYVYGMHFTGGITGYNLGTINGCTNNAKINIASVDNSLSLQNVKLDQYKDKLSNLFGDNNKQDSTSVLDSTVDTGGICGYSQGKIISCVNNALIGYEHIGYNVGGIVGRQDGYVDLCINNGEVYGRKDVGGIAGQAEPYVVIDIKQDIIEQLTTNMNTLHDLVGTTLTDAGNESNIITARLNVVKDFTDRALGDTSYLANETETWINGVMDSGNEFLNRIDYVVAESSKNGGLLDQTKSGIDNASSVVKNLTNAVDDLDIEKYMTEEEKVSYNQAKSNIKEATDRFRIIKAEHKNRDYDFYYCEYIKYNPITPFNLALFDEDDERIDWSSLSQNGSHYTVKKINDTPPPEYTDFPDPDNEIEKGLDLAASIDADALILKDTEEEFESEFQMSFARYLEENVSTIEEIITIHLQDLGDNVSKDVKYAIKNTKDSLNNFGTAVSETKSIASNLNSRSNISMPKLSPEYQGRTNSLVANIQGMSDNLGLLNNEMNSSNQTLVNDMIKVNDQFNVIMLLIADAIDGALDEDYTDVYMDNSLAVAEDSTDATIADSINYGTIHGDIDTAGIAGTMAIEYDFDLESDVTGIRDAANGVTYRTKCVLRRNKNDGYVEGLKSYVGGACGRQEMGTILHCQNFGKLSSSSGDYVGGISGESLSTIHDSYTKGILNGDEYVGGIAGKGYDIKGCFSLPSIHSTGSCIGAIAGDNDPNGRIYGNYFTSEDLAGINRVSYRSKAEPVSYYDLLEFEGIPTEFRTIRVSFVLDDKVQSVKEFKYGDYVSSIPSEISDTEYILWDWDNLELNDLKADTELIGNSAKYITTLASLQMRENGQSAVLVDGKFVKSDVLVSELSGMSSDPSIIETWKLTIPDDFEEEHLIRYCPPSSIKDFKILLIGNYEDAEAELVQMGKYYTFSVPGQVVQFIVKDTYVNPVIKYAGFEIAGIIVLIIILVMIIHRNRNPKKRKVSSAASSKRIKDDIEYIDLKKQDD